MYSGTMLLFALVLVFLNGLFVAAEFSFVKVRKTKLDLLAAEGNKRAVSALFGVHHLDAYLSVCQLGITLASLGLGWIGEPALAHLLRPLLVLLSINNPALLSSLAVILGFTIITLLHVVFGELVPKSLSIQKAESMVLWLAYPMRFFYVFCLPAVSIMTGISNLVLRVVRVHPASESELSHSPEELRLLILDSDRGGLLAKDEGRMLDNIFSFYQKSAKDIMVYRADAMAFDANESVENMVRLARESGHTRFPVYDDNRDNIIGFIHIRDILLRDGSTNLRPLLRTPFYAPETMRLEDMLKDMRASRQQMAVVVDEYGQWQGIVTMEDIVEAIVGDIQDEFDQEAPDFLKEAEGSYSLSGDLSLDDVGEYIPLDCGLSGPDMYKILAAHFFETLNRIPEEGDSMELCGLRFTVTRMDKNRVRRVRAEEICPTPHSQTC